ncbi:HAD-IC family P-type ATPase [Micromonospora sp. LOL_023]|uniref:HAD-IC family P-type ATPase n=1 Tax=Micromonospora sp. LOL_023 TaxID=3345418 RepID=UPI003A851881
MLVETGPTADPGGLDVAEVARRMAEYGPNTVPDGPARTGLPRRVARQLTDPLVALLLAAGVVTTLLADYPNTAVILLVVVVNTAIGVAQEVRADRAIAALGRLAAPVARVLRGGVDQVVPAAELVPGDRVKVTAGDVVPADLVLVDASRLQCDESTLTGESVPVRRGEGDPAHAGTVVVTGRATGVVTRTGADSALGRVAALMRDTRPGQTPLQRRLNRLGRLLGLTAVLLSGLVFLIGLGGGQPVAELAVTAVSLVVAAVPESLPAVVTLALALGAHRMARVRAVPRRLHAVETLGSVTIVAADKTGTVTEGRMAVQRAVTNVGRYDIDGVGYQPSGRIVRCADPDLAGTDPTGTDPTDPTVGVAVGVAPDDLRQLARAALLCNDAELIAPDSTGPTAPDSSRPTRPDGDIGAPGDGAGWRAVGDPLEAALVAFAGRVGLAADEVRRAWPRVAEHPFDQANRRMATVHRTCDGQYLTVCKGAPETVLTSAVSSATADELAVLADQARTLAEQGLRTLAVAAAVGATPPDPARPRGLRPLGLLGIGDPVRSDAPDVARTFAAAGIRLLLVTGDHPGTAAAVGSQLGIWSAGDPVATTPDSPDGARVFARIQPEQKLDVVAALQARGHVVAMTGDGVNDGPALRRADIGVAMGSGTDVARQAADLVLVDDNLRTVATAVGEGRRIYDNIRRFLRYALAGGVAELAVMLLGPLFGLALPLLPGQILWINLLTHGVPGVALGAEPAEPDVLDRPPRPPTESVLGAGLGAGVLGIGALITAVTLAAGVTGFHTGRPWQTMVFVTLGLAQLGVALAVRARRPRSVPAGDSGGWRRMGNPGLLVAVATAAVLQIAGVYLGPLAALLGTDPLTVTDLAGCAAVAALPALTLHLSRSGNRSSSGPDSRTRPPGGVAARRRPDQKEHQMNEATTTATETTTSTDRPIAAVLAEAAAAAGYAPSVHNTQPWHWRVRPEGLELRAARDRQLPATDLDGRLLMLSCGAALHHARIALAAQGWTAQVRRLPDADDPDLLAVLRPTEQIPVPAGTVRLVQAMRVRHTDRRPVSDEPVPVASVTAITAATGATVRMQILSSDQVLLLAAAASRAEELASEDPQIHGELDYWTGLGAPAGTGLPEQVLPEQPAQTTVPGRDFGRAGTLPVGGGHDRAAVYTLLFGDDDDSASWLAAGEALSASWLTATELGISVVPLSGAVEATSTRQTLRHILAELGHPYLVLRLGIASPDHAGPPHTPRMPTAQVVDTSEVRGTET